VLALPSANVGLVRAFHAASVCSMCERESPTLGAGSERRSIDDDFPCPSFPQALDQEAVSKLLHTAIGRCPIERGDTHFPQVWRMVWRYMFTLHISYFFPGVSALHGSLRERSHAAMLAPFQESREETRTGCKPQPR
jgi:hypothetical protein